MSRRLTPFALCLLLTLVAASAPAEDDWRQWRGPSNIGVVPEADPPVTWSEQENIRWKVALPGLGTSTPIVVGDRIFLTTAIDTGQAGESFSVHEWVVLAFDRATGDELWRHVAYRGEPITGTHTDGTWASSSPSSDGERIYAFFGSYGLYALTLDGEEVWQRDFGNMRTRMSFGEAASPALYANRLIVPWDQEDQSKIFVVDTATGETVWQRERDEPTAWATPLVVEHGGRTHVIVNATNRVRSYDLGTGEVIWEASGMTLNVIPTPVYADGVVYVTSGFRGNALMAIRLEGASGDVTDTDRVLWSFDQDTPYVPSPLLYRGRLYFLKRNNPILTVFDAASGERLYGPERLEGMTNVYASPVGAAGRVYFAGRKGGAVVLEDGPELKVLANNQLDDAFDASPVIVGEVLYLRGRGHLYAIAEGGP